MVRFQHNTLVFAIFLLLVAIAIAFQRIHETFFFKRISYKGKIKSKWTFYLLTAGYLITSLGVLAEYFLLSRKINYWVVVLGFILYFTALIIRKWCIKTLGVYHSVFIETRKHHNIIRNGPYGYLRHPYYSSVFIEVLGLTLIANSYFASISILFFLVPPLIIRIILEEKELSQKVGADYIKYKQETPMFLPFQILKKEKSKTDKRPRVVITGIGVIYI